MINEIYLFIGAAAFIAGLYVMGVIWYFNYSFKVKQKYIDSLDNVQYKHFMENYKRKL